MTKTSDNKADDAADSAPKDEGGTGQGAKPTGAAAPLHEGLFARLSSAVFLIPVSLAFVVAGSWIFALSLVLVTALMAFEWNRLVLGAENRGRIFVHFLVFTVFIVVALAFGLEGHWNISLYVTGLTTVLVFFLALRQGVGPIWPAVGVPYLFLPMISFVWLRELEIGGVNGIATIVWILLVVWGSDTGGYVAGKSFGGPKLAPAISPQKTWSGFLGGLALAMVGGLVMGLYVGEGSILVLIGLSALLSVVSQIGDLVESAVKRHFGVKDFSSLIPGHGGVFDRFDGLLFVLAAAGLLQLMHDGPLLIW